VRDPATSRHPAAAGSALPEWVARPELVVPLRQEHSAAAAAAVASERR
jgi:hypothetical protein